MSGTLYVVATPLGNLGDWSPRAREVVAAVDFVLVEDTRVSRKLFDAFDLHPKMRVFEKHRERRETEPVLQELLGGRSAALLTDAGTPGISDPGAVLVEAALRAGLKVVAVPGPSILAAAVSVSGVAENPICFHGYPPEKAGERAALFAGWRGDTGAHVILLAPHDAGRMLDELAAALPNRPMVLCREITKLHETVYAGTAGEIAARLTAEEAFRGEMALVVRGAEPEQVEPELAELIAEAARLRDALRIHGRELSDYLAFRTGVPRKLAYRAVQSLRQSDT